MTSSYNPITGTSSADSLFGSTSADSIDALGGDDIVYNGGSESDIVALGTGNDSINFSSDADGAEIYGQGGNDSLGLTASLNTSTVSGGTANDTIWISKGTAYKAYGDLGNDTIQINSDFTGSSVFGGNTQTPLPAMVPTAFLSVVLPLLLTPPVTVVLTPSTSQARSSGGSSVFGGQGNDFSIDAASTVSASYLTGNLGNDTIKVGSC